MENTVVSICRAIVQEGPRKGQSCCFPPDEESGYCGRHLRNKEYDDGIAAGKKWCRFFFRGCSNTCTGDKKSCDTCREKMHSDKTLCKHDGCKHHVNDSTNLYCKKHVRDVYRDEEKAKGIRYCDIARGCIHVCKEGLTTCDTCLEQNRKNDNARYNARKQLHTVIQQVSSPSGMQVCCYCGKDYPSFITQHGKTSISCQACNQNQAHQDAKRADRVRNYKQENMRNQPRHFREYFRNAMKRNVPFLLTPEEFQTFVLQPCHYCGTHIQNESIGIDRTDSAVGYTSDNCVPCCEICNKMKFIYCKEFFLEKCKYMTDGVFPSNFHTTWKEYYMSRPASYSHYASGAKKRNIAFHLSKEEWNLLMTQACYICKYTGNIGIDRMDNSTGYTKENCKPCCSSCNHMKWDLPLSIVFVKAKQITDCHFPS